MKKKTKTKLDLIRLEGLCKLILDNLDEDTIKNKILIITKTEPRDTKVLYKLSRKILIKIIESSNISDEEIEKYYEEYRYGLKPGFSIYSFKSNKMCTMSTLMKKIKSELEKLQNIEEEQPPIKNIRFNNIDQFSEDMCEYSFYYSKKYTYIDDKEEPNYIYELKETFVWISTRYHFVAIKNCDERVVKILSKLFSVIYGTELIPIMLTQGLIKEIFGDKKKKVAGVNPNAGESEAEKIIVSDSNLDKKEELNRQLEQYITTSENLEVSISDKLNTLGINNAKGKLHLTKNMTATVFREWSINSIRKIIEYIAKNETDFEIFKAKNIMESSFWDDYNLETKNLIEEIIFKILNYNSNKEGYNPKMSQRIDYSKVLGKNFFAKIFIECINCQDSHCIPKCHCGSYNIKIGKKNNVFCGDCGENLTSLECEDGHNINIENLQNISIYIIPDSSLYEKIKQFIKQKFNINFNGYVIISNSVINITEKSIGGIISASKITEFNNVLKTEINETERNTIEKRLKSIKEKCKESTKENCNVCHKSSKECCILQLFSTYEGYRPSPHHGHEFGDLDFKVEFEGKKYQFVGIVKSSCNLTHASPQGREMIQQIISASQDRRIEIIGAVCPTRFDTQFEKDLDYIAKCTHSKIVILDDVFMMKQFKYYDIRHN